MKRIKKQGFCLLVLLFPALVFAHDKPSPIVPEKTVAPFDAEVRFEEVAAALADFKKQNRASLIRQFEERGKPIMSLGRADRKKKQYYRGLKDEIEFWGYVKKLKNDLIGSYAAFHQSAPREMESESNQVAYSVIKGIYRLRDLYNIHTFPLVHNFIIDIGLASRGGCKHWAEDVLNVINTVEHPHFVSYWAEAHPGKMTEHNTAVIAPQGAPFDAGIMIDPWRTAGEPYWSLVKEDDHPWQVWEGYQPR